MPKFPFLILVLELKFFNAMKKYDFEEIIYVSGSIVCLIGIVFLIGFILKVVAHLI